MSTWARNDRYLYVLLSGLRKDVADLKSNKSSGVTNFKDLQDLKDGSAYWLVVGEWDNKPFLSLDDAVAIASANPDYDYVITSLGEPITADTTTLPVIPSNVSFYDAWLDIQSGPLRVEQGVSFFNCKLIRSGNTVDPSETEYAAAVIVEPSAYPGVTSIYNCYTVSNVNWDGMTTGIVHRGNSDVRISGGVVYARNRGTSYTNSACVALTLDEATLDLEVFHVHLKLSGMSGKVAAAFYVTANATTNVNAEAFSITSWNVNNPMVVYNPTDNLSVTFHLGSFSVSTPTDTIDWTPLLGTGYIEHSAVVTPYQLAPVTTKLYPIADLSQLTFSGARLTEQKLALDMVKLNFVPSQTTTDPDRYITARFPSSKTLEEITVAVDLRGSKFIDGGYYGVFVEDDNAFYEVAVKTSTTAQTGLEVVAHTRSKAVNTISLAYAEPILPTDIVFLRIVNVENGSLNCLYSLDGETWFQFWSLSPVSLSSAASPNGGLVVDTYTAITMGEAIATFRWFSYTEQIFIG